MASSGRDFLLLSGVGVQDSEEGGAHPGRHANKSLHQQPLLQRWNQSLPDRERTPRSSPVRWRWPVTRHAANANSLPASGIFSSTSRSIGRSPHKSRQSPVVMKKSGKPLFVTRTVTALVIAGPLEQPGNAGYLPVRASLQASSWVLPVGGNYGFRSAAEGRAFVIFLL